MLNNLFGKGKEPFWQQAYTNLVKFIILLHKVVYDYVTLFDVYECAINPHKLEAKIAEGEELFSTADYIAIDDTSTWRIAELSRFPWERIEGTNWMKAPATDELKRILDAKRIPCDIQSESGPRSPKMNRTRNAGNGLKRSSAGLTMTGDGSSPSCGPPSSKASRSSSRCSTTILR